VLRVRERFGRENAVPLTELSKLIAGFSKLLINSSTAIYSVAHVLPVMICEIVVWQTPKIDATRLWDIKSKYRPSAEAQIG
jgi:hypothetical protein